MKLTIDTRTDSPDEIRKAIRLLQSLINEAPSDYPSSAPLSQEASSDMFSMFNTPTESSSSAPLSSSTVVKKDDDEFSEEIPQVIPY